MKKISHPNRDEPTYAKYVAPQQQNEGQLSRLMRNDFQLGSLEIILSILVIILVFVVFCSFYEW